MDYSQFQSEVTAILHEYSAALDRLEVVSIQKRGGRDGGPLAVLEVLPRDPGATLVTVQFETCGYRVQPGYGLRQSLNPLWCACDDIASFLSRICSLVVPAADLGPASTQVAVWIAVPVTLLSPAFPCPLWLLRSVPPDAALSTAVDDAAHEALQSFESFDALLSSIR
jgi:hypothetical protein